MRYALTSILALSCLCAPGVSRAAQDVPAASSAQGAAINRGFPALAHVGIVVKDVDQAVRDAQARFGLAPSSLVTKIKLELANARYLGKAIDFSATFCLIELGNTQLEFIQSNDDRQSPYSDALKAHKDGVVHHLAFTVPSIDRQLTDVRQQNPKAKIVLDGQIPNSSGRYVYVDGVLPGILVEYIEMGTPAKP